MTGVRLPNSTQIQWRAKELRLMEELPLAEFIKLYGHLWEEKVVNVPAKPVQPPEVVSLPETHQQIMHRAMRRSLRIIG